MCRACKEKERRKYQGLGKLRHSLVRSTLQQHGTRAASYQRKQNRAANFTTATHGAKILAASINATRPTAVQNILILNHTLLFSQNNGETKSFMYSIRPWSWKRPEKPPVVQQLMTFPTLYRTIGLTTVFEKTFKLYYSVPDQSSSHHPILSLRSILILTIHIRLVLPSDLLPSDFLTNIL
jgi:hypothetical protein